MAKDSNKNMSDHKDLSYKKDLKKTNKKENKISNKKNLTKIDSEIKEIVTEISEEFSSELEKTNKNLKSISSSLGKVKEDLDEQMEPKDLTRDSWLKSQNLQAVFAYSKDLIQYTFLKRAVFSVLAGFFVGISYLLFVLIKASFYTNGIAPSAEWAGIANFLGALMFPFAIFAIIYLGGNLYTSNSLMYVAAFKKIIKFRFFMYQLAITWFFNFVGTLLMVGISYLIFSENQAAHEVANDIAIHKLEDKWWSTLASGFLCNIIVTGSIYGYKVIPSKTVGFLFVYLLIVFFALSGFQHTVANMYIIPLGLSYETGHQAADLWGQFFYSNLLPVTFSNTLGGLTIPILYIMGESKVTLHKKRKVVTTIDATNSSKSEAPKE